MPRRLKEFEAGTTVQCTWGGSDAPSSLYLRVITASETLVRSVSAIQSGGGNWYAFVTVPDSFTKYPCNLMAEWTATLSTHAGNASQFVNRMEFVLIKTKAYPVSV